ncbi:MAG: hypothetical protein MJZ82_04850 [Paludibacteraceae bacterium]|nr:hypothetical protein [Paludibacteraceae bacterium]
MGLFDLLFGSTETSYDPEEWFGESRKKKHYGRSCSNWTDREDWSCDSEQRDGMSGFDSYEESDF